MTETLLMFPEPDPAADIEYGGKLYRPYRKGMEDGWDTVKSGKRRPHGWGRYLFIGGYVVFDKSTRQCVGSVKTLPRECCA